MIENGHPVKICVAVDKEKSSETEPFQRIFGRSGEAQTRGLRIPNAARYQLRYTPIVYLIVVM